MAGGRPAAGGGRWVQVAPARLAGWLQRYEQSHGALLWSGEAAVVSAGAPDGSRLTVEVPFPPLAAGPLPETLVGHALQQRRVGVLLVRLGGWAAGVFDGDHLISSKVDSRQVQGRTAAGGWSQQRFARRRAGQARVALQDAVAVAERVLLPAVDTLDALVTGGDRSALRTVLAAPSLAPLLPLLVERVLDVPDPRLRVLAATPDQFLAVQLLLEDGERDGALPSAELR